MSDAPDFALCRYFATRPHNCGGVAGQVVGYAPDGTPIVWRCMFCAPTQPLPTPPDITTDAEIGSQLP